MARIDPHRAEFQVQDYAGRIVRLRTARWVNHVLFFHPDMLGHQGDVIQALQAPEKVFRTVRRGRQRWVYWKSAVIGAGSYVAVVVERMAGSPEMYEIVTAFEAVAIEEEGVQEWPES